MCIRDRPHTSPVMPPVSPAQWEALFGGSSNTGNSEQVTSRAPTPAQRRQEPTVLSVSRQQTPVPLVQENGKGSRPPVSRPASGQPDQNLPARNLEGPQRSPSTNPQMPHAPIDQPTREGANRDSQAQATRAAQPNPAPAGSPNRPSMDSPVPVSYTHLTLPTKRIV